VTAGTRQRTTKGEAPHSLLLTGASPALYLLPAPFARWPGAVTVRAASGRFLGQSTIHAVLYPARFRRRAETKNHGNQAQDEGLATPLTTGATESACTKQNKIRATPTPATRC